MPAFSPPADGESGTGLAIPGHCHYKEGNRRARRPPGPAEAAAGPIRPVPRRCRFDHVSATEGEKYRRLIGTMAEERKSLGPLRVNG
ncbi:MAG: hydrogenase iron-sulfur subunit [Desulfurivibrio sp.]|nr:hydrogenase iron-sulfur subunit [Desulfurivibrio sp.]